MRAINATSCNLYMLIASCGIYRRKWKFFRDISNNNNLVLDTAIISYTGTYRNIFYILGKKLSRILCLSDGLLTIYSQTLQIIKIAKAALKLIENKKFVQRLNWNGIFLDPETSRVTFYPCIAIFNNSKRLIWINQFRLLYPYFWQQIRSVNSSLFVVT